MAARVLATGWIAAAPVLVSTGGVLATAAPVRAPPGPGPPAVAESAARPASNDSTRAVSLAEGRPEREVRLTGDRPTAEVAADEPGVAAAAATVGPTGSATPGARAGPTGSATPTAGSSPAGFTAPVARAGPVGSATPTARAGPVGFTTPVARARPTGSAAPVAAAGPTGSARSTGSADPIARAGPTGSGDEPGARTHPHLPGRARAPDAAGPDADRVQPAAPAGAGVPAPGAGYAWPLHPPPTVASPFRAPEHAYGPGHRGADLAGAVGQAVLAARAGVVVFAGPVGGRGVVSVEHDDGLRTTYEPVHPTVRAGTAVAAGSRARRARSPAIGAARRPACTGACAATGWSTSTRWSCCDRPAYGCSRPSGVNRHRLDLPRPAPTRAEHAAQPAASSSRRPRSRPTRRVCSWHTRDSVTPSSSPISASVRFSR